MVTNDIFTKEDQEFLIRNQALSDPDRIRAIETGEYLIVMLDETHNTLTIAPTLSGGCPHAAIRYVAPQTQQS